MEIVASVPRGGLLGGPDGALAGHDRHVDVAIWRDVLMSLRPDHDAEFEAFFLTAFDSIVRSVTVVCGDAERASDATQEAFIKAYARWGRVRRYDQPAAWVRRIAINATRDMHRSDQRRARREEQVSARDEVGDTSHGSSALDLLVHLPDRQRAVAALYYLDELTTAQISDALGISEGTVRFHLSEARARLRDVLDPDEEGGRVVR